MDDSDGTREHAFGEVECDQQLVFDLIRDGGFRQDRHPDADFDRTFDGFNIVKLHHVIYRDPVLFEDAVDGLARRDVALKGDEILPRQRPDADPAATRQPMFRVTNNDQLVVPERDDGDIGPPQGQRYDTEIDGVV